MNGDIKLSAPGGLPGDIWLNGSAPAPAEFVFQGRVVGLDGSPRSGVAITVFERRSLTMDVRLAATMTDARGRYRATFSLPGVSSRHAASECCQCCPPAGREPHRCNSDWDLFIRATDSEESESADSALVCTLDPGTYIADLVLGDGDYMGLSEWDRVTAKIDPFLGDTLPKDIPADKLEWLCKRADVFPLHAAMWIQAYRLSFERTIKEESCYAFLRAGMPADMPGILRAGEGAWESALRNAWTRRVIPRPGDGTPTELDTEVALQIAAMRELVVEAATVEMTTALNPRSFFDSVGLDVADQQEFYGMWLDHTGTLAEFWEAVGDAPNLATLVGDFQYAIQGAAVVGYHPPTLAALRTTSVASIAVTAAWDFSTWDSFLVAQSVTPPEGTPGEDATERRQNYARMLERASEDAYPTLSLRHRIDADDPPHTEHLVDFFEDNPAFDVLTTNIDRWVAANPTAFAGTSDPAEARTNLEIVQRVYRLAPRLGRYETTKILLEQGIRSAADATAFTRDEFVNEFTEHFTDNHHDPEALAERVWDRGARISGSAQAMGSYLGLSRSSVQFQPVASMGDWGWEDAENGMGSLADILGSLDYCACSHCRSVFSPAAYLADLLHFLAKRKTSGSNALNVLLLRRPDLEYIWLDCANTNTVLPYIDLVNELLERYFAETLDGSSYQTTWTAEQLRLRPEHQDAAVYQGTVPGIDAQLTELVHPWILPFHLPEIEARQLLEHFGVPRHRLMELLVDDNADPVTPNMEAIAAEALGMSLVEHTIIAGEFDNPSTDDREFWGYVNSEGTNSWYSILNGTHETEGNVRELLRRGDYSLAELQGLLSLTYIDPNHYDPTGIEFNWAETCDLGDAEILNLNVAALDRLHRFTRLQRRTTIPSRMLNVLIDEVGGGTLNDTFLGKLVDIRNLQRRTRLAWDELATWWAVRIDARAYADGKPSLYHRRFLVAQNATPAGFQPESDRGDDLDGELEIPVAISVDELPTLLAAANLSEADYNRLRPTFANDEFTFANLTAIFRTASLARATKLSIDELVTLRTLTGIDPFTSPATALDFLEALDGIRASGFTIAELDWLLRHVGTAMIDDATIGRTLGTLSRGLATVDAEIDKLVDPDGSAVRANLADVVISVDTDLEPAMLIVDGESALSEVDQGTFITAQFASFVDTDLAIAQLVTDGGELTDLTERRNWLLQTFIGNRRKRALLVDTASAAFRIQSTVAEKLLYEMLHQPDTSDLLGTTFASSFATDAQITKGLIAEDHEDQFIGWLRLAKAAIIVRQHQITAEQLTWYPGHLTGAWLDIDALPLDVGDTDATFSAWNRLRQALDLRELFGDDEMGHRALTLASTADDALDLLAEYTGWDAVELKFVADAIGWDAASDFNDEINLGRLHSIALAGQRIGVGLDVLWTWVHGSMTLAKAAKIEAAARAKYGEERWPEIATPHRDRLREQQRDALVSAILATSETLTTREQIFEQLLIDVEMSACMLTTRIVQANSSVQMFVHRVLLQLEAPAVKFQPGAAHAWSWMKNYRVWEANRKVFLYPENWIEPALRGDKTPEFERLESELLQDTLDNAKVERGLIGYLAGLDRVANLEIVAVYAHDPYSTVWLLGRTQSAPRTWFLRKRGHNDPWGPWEELPLEIDSNNVVLLEREGRILLFWLTTIDGTVSRKPVEFGEYQNFRTVELAITWAERDDRGWTQTVMSERTAAYETLSQGPDSHLLRAWILSDYINIIVFRTPGYNYLEPRAEFHYDIVSRHVTLAGTDFLASNYPNLLGNDNFLHQSLWVGLQSDYHVEGQRFAKTLLNPSVVGVGGNGGGGVKWNNNPDKADPPLDSGTAFYQADYYAPMFHKASITGYRTLLHQGDLWTPTPSMRFCPVVYDDRQRKYLLEPRDGFSDASSEGEEISPDLIGGLDYSQYQGCMPASEPEIIHSTAPTNKQQQQSDKINTGTYWTGGIPDQNSGTQTFVGVGGQGTGTVLHNLSTGTMGGNTNTVDDGGPGVELVPGTVRIQMTTLYHPFARKLVETVALHGVDALYRPSENSVLFRQIDSVEPMSGAFLNLDSELQLIGKEPMESYDFNHASAYGVYNWEVFFHIPMLIADKLRTDQRWAEAQRWYHTMFDPIETVEKDEATAPSKFWRIKPFFDQAENLAKDQFEAMLGIGVTPAEQETAIAQFEAEVKIWRENPFDPHAVARIRPGVYQRALLRSYFDNLIEWADHLFRQDTLESINEATILYVLVSQLLGPRPEEVPGPDGPPKSYHDLVEEGIDEFSNAAQKLENWILVPTEPAEHLCPGVEPLPPWVREKVEIRFWYFCYPPNPELLKYWDTIADRLWKIRHCQNIEGMERRLAIFQPPIDPGLLVRAAAAGVDLASVLAELDSGLPPYRFRSVVARANAFCGDLRTLGGALLQALEKRDAEALARLQAEQGLTMLAAVRDVRVRQLDEAHGAVESLKLSKLAVEGRLEYYEELVDVGVNDQEVAAMGLGALSGLSRVASQAIMALGGALQLIPDFTISVGTDMSAKTTIGGVAIGGALKSAGEALGILPTMYDTAANWIITNAQYQRRQDEWDFQVGQADADIARIDRDIAVAEIRVAIAQRELDNHDLQVEQSKATDRFMREKFSNRELYDWMVGQLSTLYFQTYQLAFDLAKRAERAYRHELAIDGGAPIIKYGYWDSLRKGLLAGEKLGHDLQRLDLAYMDHDVREYELRKSISLARLNATELHKLQETGTCNINIPEILFDLDHPGHVLRRIRSVSLTIPAVTDPHTSLGARLSLTEHWLRRNADVEEPELGYGGKDRIATSTAMSDSGLFNLDFRDERYLPFEYAGAISSWKLELPDKVPQFDYRTISDVVMSIAYTARDGGDDFRGDVQDALDEKFNEAFAGGATQLFVVHRAFPNEWAQFLSPAEEDEEQVLTLPVKEQHFPVFARRQGFTIKSVQFRLLFTDDITDFGVDVVETIFSVGATAVSLSLASDGPYASGTAGSLTTTPGTWTLTREKDPDPAVIVADDWLDPTKVVGMLMLVRYELVEES